MFYRLDHQVDRGAIDVSDDVGERDDDDQMPLLERRDVRARLPGAGRIRRRGALTRERQSSSAGLVVFVSAAVLLKAMTMPAIME